MKEAELKPCPFCCGEAELVHKMIYVDHGYRVECKDCFAQTRLVLVDHPKVTYKGTDETTRYTEEQAKAKAIEYWNRRADNEEK